MLFITFFIKRSGGNSLVLQYFSSTTKKIEVLLPGEKIDVSALWYDLCNPSLEERENIEKGLALTLPTDQKMSEIESSSRFYQKDGFSYMTMNLIASADSEHPLSAPVTLILSNKYFLTLRYTEFHSFQTFTKMVEKNFCEGISSQKLFFSLIEIIIDRIADIVEMIGREIDSISQEIFNNKTQMVSHQFFLKDILSSLGKRGDLTTKVRLSLENLHRLLNFCGAQVFTPNELLQHAGHLSTLQQDVLSIIDHISFIFHKTNFLLDATLGLINIEQNGIVKILSAAAVIFLPPMLIASIYGMNFSHMPELNFAIGYPLAVLLMIVSSIVPYFYCKRKGWFQ